MTEARRRSRLTIDFCDFCAARTIIDSHPSAFSNGTLGVFRGLQLSASTMALLRGIAYLVLHESERHAVGVASDLDIAYTEPGEGSRDMILKLVICLGLHKAPLC